MGGGGGWIPVNTESGRGKTWAGGRGRGREETPVSGNRRVSWEKGQEQGFRGGLELKLQGLGFRG